MASPNPYSKQFTTQDVIDLGGALIAVADKYPTRYLTERDFFPLVCAYLHGRVPRYHVEAAVTSGAIDFRLGGTNPSVLELAVAPRALGDLVHTTLGFPGHGKATQLYATQNASELRKLAGVSQSAAKMRYLLLLDFRSWFSAQELAGLYAKQAAKMSLRNPVKVVYVARDRDAVAFTIRRNC